MFLILYPAPRPPPPPSPPPPCRTHLLRTIFANSDVECMVRAKHSPIKPDRSSWMTRSQKLCEGNHSTSLLDATFPSEPNRDLPFVRLAGSGLSRLPLTINWKIAGTLSPPCCLVFVGQDRQSWVPGPLLEVCRVVKNLEHENPKYSKRKTEQ